MHTNEALAKFITNFFALNHCKVSTKDEGIVHVQLTEAMDRALMNRPFYWHYMNSTGQQGQPMQVTFIIDPDKRDESGEWIHFGSPRLHQMIYHLKTNAKFTQLFQQIQTKEQTPLYPWLIINMKISYTGKLIKEEIFSIGLNLVSGLMKTNMMDQLKNLSFKLQIPDYCYPISPLIKIPSGFKRIETIFDQYIENQTHSWAIESLQELEQEKQLIHYFFQHEEHSSNKRKKLEEIYLRYMPTITFNVINGGLFYLHENALKKTE